jgi:hypothetical protein
VNAFTVGQRVTILGRLGGIIRLTEVERVTSRGSRVYVKGWQTPFDRHGYTPGFQKIVPTTSEHGETVRRAELWEKIDAALGTLAGAEERNRKRSAISMETLAQIVALLGGHS